MNPMHLSSMTRPKSILVATDLNDLDFLLPVAIDQARMTGAMIWLLHVIPPQAYASTKPEPILSLKKRRSTAPRKLFSPKLRRNYGRRICLAPMRFVDGTPWMRSRAAFGNTT